MVKNRLMNVLVVALVLGLSATSSFAQNQGQGGRGGRGGFGGGFGGGGFGQRTVLSLVSNEAVIKELALSEEAAGKLKKISEEITAEQRKGFEGFARLRDLPEAERTAKMAELRKKAEENAKTIRETYTPKIKEVLTAEQFTRVQQIAYQANSLSSNLADAEVAKALDLTKEQQDKVAALTKEFSDKGREIGMGEGSREKREALNKERDTAFAGVLTAEQTAKWTALKGKEFDTTKLRGAGGPGGRQGRRPGGNAGGNGGRPATE